MKSCRKYFFLGVTFLFVLSCFCGCGKKYNIFTEFADIKDNSILPKHITYGKLLNDVLKDRGLTEADVTGTKDRYVITEYTAEHIPYTVREKLYFVSEEHEEIKDQLYKVDYLIEIKEEDREKAFAAFYEQAKAAMPAPDDYLNSLEDMKTGKSLVWTDAEGNTLSFSTAASQDGITFVIISLRGSAYQRN